MPVICALSSLTSAWILLRPLGSCAAMISDFMSCRRLVTSSAADRATPTVEDARSSVFLIVLKLSASVDMTVEMAQIAALSFAFETLLPVEISDWTWARLRLVLRSDSRAIIELLLVRILDMLVSLVRVCRHIGAAG